MNTSEDTIKEEEKGGDDSQNTDLISLFFLSYLYDSSI